MFLKRKLIIALDQYEDEYPDNALLGTNRSQGIKRADFIHWFLRHPGSKKLRSAQQLDKCIDDCIEDKYINRNYVEGDGYLVAVQSEDGFYTGQNKIKYKQDENIYLSSSGRELEHWYFFWPAVLKKMSIWEIILLGITTSLTLVGAILLAKLGIKG